MEVKIIKCDAHLLKKGVLRMRSRIAGIKPGFCDDIRSQKSKSLLYFKK